MLWLQAESHEIALAGKIISCCSLVGLFISALGWLGKTSGSVHIFE